MASNLVAIFHQDLYDFVRQSRLTIQKSAIIKTQSFPFIKSRVEYDAESLTNKMEFDVWTKIRLFVDQLHTRWFTCGHNESAFKKRYGAWLSGKINLPPKG